MIGFVQGMTPEQTFTKLNPYFLGGVRNHSQIERETGVPRRTISRYLEKFDLGIQVVNLRPRGRPLQFPRNLNNKIAKKMKENNSASAKMIANSLNEKLNPEISRRTVSRRLNEMGYKRVKPKPCLRLKPHHVKARVKFYKTN